MAPTRRKGVPKSDVVRVFKALKLATRQQRDKVLKSGAVPCGKSTTEQRYTLRLSNSSEQEPPEKSDDAELE